MEEPLEFSCRLWDNEAISAGDTTDPIPTWGYDEKEIMFVSDTAGTLTILGDVYGETLREYKTLSIDANTPKWEDLLAPLSRIQLKFDTGATVTAEVNLQ